MSCYNCGGSGRIITCIDDICRGADECMHGDGEDVCPVCGGEEEEYEEYDEDYPEPPLIFRGPEVVMPAQPVPDAERGK